MRKPKTIEPAKDGSSVVKQPNSWVAEVSADVRAENFSVTLPLAPTVAPAIIEGDGVAFVSERDEKMLTIAFGRIYRVRSGLEATTLYFDTLVTVEPPMEAASLGLPVPSGIVGRVDWPTYHVQNSVPNTGTQYDALA